MIVQFTVKTRNPLLKLGAPRRNTTLPDQSTLERPLLQMLKGKLICTALAVLCLVGMAQGQEAKPENKPDVEEESVKHFMALSAKEKLIFAVQDKELLASRAQMADLSGAGDNPYLKGFPAPRPYSTHPNYATKLKTRTDGLSYKPRSVYEEQLPGLQGFLANNFIPNVKKYCESGDLTADFNTLKFAIAARPNTDDLNVQEDIPYNVLGKRALVLDLYLPKAPPNSEGYPVLMFFHGGGWLGGHHYSNRAVAISMAKQGFATIVVEYRLGKEAIFPAAVWDGKAAVRWVRKHAEKYHLDTNMILVSGGSAGGNIAGLVGMTKGDPRFEGDGNHKEFSSDVHGVIAYDGAVHQGSSGWTGGGEGRPKPVEADPWFYNEAIPLFHIIHKDGGVPILFVKGGRPLHLWIQKYINNIQVDWLDHRWVHGFEVFDPSKDILVEQLMEYFKSDQSLWAGKLNL
jgi:pectinesterase